MNGNVTVVIWGDNTKTRATRSIDDIFDANIGFAMCLAKKLYGKKRIINMLRRAQIQVAK
jgi:hypothetical protein